MVTTAQILAERALQMECDQQCVDWANRLLDSEHLTDAAFSLSSKLPPYSHFELASLRDQILEELRVLATSDDQSIIMYSVELLSQAISGSTDLSTAVSNVKDLFLGNNLSPEEIQDFYLLHFASIDLQQYESQYYWPGADRSNIELIMRNRTIRFLQEYEDRTDMAT